MIWEAQEAKRSELLEEITEGNQKKLFKIVKQITQAAVDALGPTCVKGEAENIVIEAASVKEAWRCYMECLMNVENSWDGITECDATEGPRCLISQGEILLAPFFSPAR